MSRFHDFQSHCAISALQISKKYLAKFGERNIKNFNFNFKIRNFHDKSSITRFKYILTNFPKENQRITNFLKLLKVSKLTKVVILENYHGH